jgi:DNA-binding beta-propeller fold protein YncE
MAAVPMGPFGVVTTGDGRWAFISLTGPRTVGVLKVAASPVPSLIRQVPVAAAGLPGGALTPGDRYLLVADDGRGADVLSVQELEQGGRHPRAGTLAAPPGARLGGAIEVAVSPDGDFVFVSLEEGSSIAVFNLRRALSASFSAADYVGSVPAEPAMPAYVVAETDITDPEQYEQYKAASPAAIAAGRGRFLIRGGELVVRQ